MENASQIQSLIDQIVRAVDFGKRPGFGKRDLGKLRNPSARRNIALQIRKHNRCVRLLLALGLSGRAFGEPVYRLLGSGSREAATTNSEFAVQPEPS